jgi:molybdate/tungstate transport system permease protein
VTPRRLLAVAVLAAVHLGLGLVPGAPVSPAMNLVLFAANLYTLHAAALVLEGRSGGAVALFALGYVALFGLTAVWLDKKPLFVLLLVGYASVFGSRALLGLWALFVLCFVVLQPYAFETFIPLAFIATVVWRARGEASRFALVSLGAGLLGLATVLFPLIHMALSDSAVTLGRALGRADVREALLNSLFTSTVAVLAVAGWGVPLAWALARHEFPGKRVVESLVDLPILVPQSVAGVALVALLGPGAPLGQLLSQRLGLTVSGSYLGVIIAQVFVCAPFLIKTAVSGFEAVPLQLELASRSLGFGSGATFWRISLPLASRSVAIGAALAWARAVSEFGTIVLFASSPVTAPVLVHTEFLRGGATESRPLATLLLVVCLWAFLMLQLGQTMLPFAWRRREAPGGAT